MANRSALSPAQWEQVKQASIAGIPDERLAGEFCVSISAIKMRRKREGWATPSTVRVIQRKAAQACNVTANVTSGDSSQKTAVTLIREQAQEYAIRSFASLAERGSRALDAWEPATPTSIKEGLQLVQVVSRAAGFDSAGRSGSQVNVQVNVGPWGVDNQRTQETTWIDVEGENEGD